MIEMLIDGRHVDLAPDTDVTLEYVSNVLGEPGKIQLSRSYTVKLPRTRRNTEVLDDPGTLGHASTKLRRFLPARFYRNGIDLIGEAQAYMLRSTPDGYEVALVWNTLEALQALSQSDKTLNDLQGLPVLKWVGSDGSSPNYAAEGTAGDSAFFARYESGLGAYRYPDVNAATHPCIRLSALLDLVLTEAGVPYEISADASALRETVLLAAPGHKPSRAMDISSGSAKYSGVFFDGALYAGRSLCPLIYERYDGTDGAWSDGWDPVQGITSEGPAFFRSDSDRHLVRLNLQAPAGLDMSGCKLVIVAEDRSAGIANAERAELATFYFSESGGAYHLTADAEIQLSSWPLYYLALSGDWPEVNLTEFTAFDPALPIVAANCVHETISITNDNRFPLAGNLPDIKQWDFVASCLALFGLVPVIQSGKLYLHSYDQTLAKANASDWTAKVDMSRLGRPEDLSYALDGWARSKTITYQPEDPLPFDPTVRIEVDDQTLPVSAEYYALPYAASLQGNAVHYEVTEKGGVLETEDVDITPRIFKTEAGEDGTLRLVFTDDLRGDGLAQRHYAALQKVVRRPALVTVAVRLNELDLAQLDMRRPVYLGQYGQYFAIIKIQTSDTDLCKVELIQIP